MTQDEQRIAEIKERVRKTICPTFNSDGRETIEGRISKEDFEYLLTSWQAWKLVAKQNGDLARLTPTEQTKALEKALDDTMADYIDALDEIDRLKRTQARH